MDVLDVHVVIRMERAEPGPEAPRDPAALLFEHDRTETRDLGGPLVAGEAHSATITITRCLPTQHCPADAITLAVDGAEAVGDAPWLVQWPWAWVEPAPEDARHGATWSGTRRVEAGPGHAVFGFECALVERRWKGGHVRCTGAAQAASGPRCDGPLCATDLGGRYTLDARLDWVTGELTSWKHTLVTFTGVEGGVARRTVSTTAKVTRGPKAL